MPVCPQTGHVHRRIRTHWRDALYSATGLGRARATYAAVPFWCDQSINSLDRAAAGRAGGFLPTLVRRLRRYLAEAFEDSWGSSF